MVHFVMYGNLDGLINKIVENTELSPSEIENLIKEKENEFSGLITPEGAAHIVAKELGLNLLNSTSKELKIGNILSGMRSINIKGKIMKIFDVREFKKNDEPGKVVNMIIADETGQARISLWNEQVKIIEDGEIKEGDVIEIINGYTKEDSFGGAEIRIGKLGKIKKSDAKITPKTSEKGKRIKISNLTPGMNSEIRGVVVQFFETNPFFFVCPECGGKLIDGKCKEHGDVKPKPVLIISGVVDDGYGNVRVVFFREQAEKILGMNSEDAYKLAEEGKNLNPLREKLESILGKEFIINGRTKVNKFFEKLEFIADEVKEVNPEEESKAILNSLEEKKNN